MWILIRPPGGGCRDEWHHLTFDLYLEARSFHLELKVTAMALLRVRGMLGKLLGLLCFGLLGLLLISMFDRTSMRPLKTPKSMSGKHDLARSLLETKAGSNSSATAGVNNVDIKQVPTKIHKVGGGETFQGEGRLSQGQDQSSQGQHLMREKETVLSLKASSQTSNESNDAKSKLTKHDVNKTLRGNVNDKKSVLSNRTSLSVKLQHGAGARRMFQYVVSSTTTSSPQHIPTGERIFIFILVFLKAFLILFN